MLHAEVIRPVPDLIRAGAAAHGDRTALSDRAGSTTHARLAERTARLAGHLRALGATDGDVVLLLLPTGVPLVEAYLAVVRAHAVAACIAAVSTADDVAFALADCRPRLVVTDAEGAALVAAAGTGVPVVRVGDPLQPGPVPDTLPLDDPAFLLYTSGTTGRPKGVLLTQRSLLWVAAAAWLPFLGLTAADHLLVPLPLSHSYPLDLTLAALAAGGRVHLQERFSTAETARLLHAGEVTVLVGVPTTFAYLLESGASTRPAGLRLCVSAGALLPPALKARVEERLGVPLVDAYGATETSTAVALTTPGGASPAGSCGLPPPGVACRVVDPATGADLPPGAEGELIVRSPGVMLGYHDRPAETATALRGGWYRTGDLARQDRNAFLTITGRVKDIIVRGGENIAPAEIERVVIEHPDVADCAVAARPDRLLGEVPVLYAVARTGRTPQPGDLLAWCHDRLPRFKVPAEAHVVEAIPRTASGKVRRHLLAPPTPIEEHL
jgi:rifamycin polyketide synthase module 1/2/3